MSEASKHILHQRFLHEKHPNIRKKLIDLASDEIDMVTFYSLQRSTIINKMPEMGTSVKPLSFDDIYGFGLMCNQIEYHTAVQENDF